MEAETKAEAKKVILQELADEQQYQQTLSSTTTINK